jgi:hypothetical protein
MVFIVMSKILNPPSSRIFVFGSNTAGIHGKGAALHARLYYGAEPGVGVGHIGQCYAIPTKDHKLRSYDLNTIRHHVEAFIAYARANPILQFNVTKVGCGLAGHKSEDIAPMFEFAPSNCWFDPNWKELLGPTRNYWEPNI